MASYQMFLISRCFVEIILVGCFVMGSSQASIEFNVGGKYGWALRPSKTYNQWAAKNRFQVDDALVFKYKNGTDSVLVVDQEDYEACNKEKPIRSLENEGEFARIKLDHAGLFFFISGYDHYCEEGQKLVVLVMQPRGHGRVGKTLPPSQSPSPSMSPTLAPSSSPFPNFPVPAPAPVLTTPTQSPEAGSDEEAAKSGATGFGGGNSLVNLLFCLMLLLVCF